ncbi:MAG: cysteine--tRNA ligase [Cytophagales bacterium]
MCKLGCQTLYLSTVVQKLSIYDTYTGKLLPFVAGQPSRVGFYLCGPTVYGDPHLGHGRHGVNFDVMIRYLRHLGYDVCYVRNITDVGHLTHDGDDKVIKKAQVEGIAPMEIAQRYTNRYQDAMRKLNNLRPNIEPLATGHIPEQIALVATLLEKGWAYEVNGSVYFDLHAYQTKKEYGQLSGRKVSGLKSETRPLATLTEKRHPHDFALWKKAQPNHAMRWSSPWSEGYPGWHLECTAMSKKYLGETFDIHGGGLDLCFPHHECEIAQAVSSTGKIPARYWVHNNLVLINKKKMSKSANNFITLEDCFGGTHPLLSQAYDPMVVRFFILQAHYRSTLNFSDEALKAAKKGYLKLMNALHLLDHITIEGPSPSQAGETYAQTIQHHCQSCYHAMNHDFNTAKVIAALMTLRKVITQVHTGHIDPKQINPTCWKKLKKTYTTFLVDLLGLQPPRLPQTKQLLTSLLKSYAAAKANQQEDQVEAIRKDLKAQGITLQDQNSRVNWSYET